jgi:transportin-3
MQSWKDTFTTLVTLIIKHFTYPEDMDGWTAGDRDEFRDFRHDIGDCVKDSVTVIGELDALLVPLNILSNVGEGGRWQEFEAPLFCLRSMGGKISEDEGEVVPKMMGFLPQLPSHPKITYAVILVIGRYSGWTAKVCLVTYFLASRVY